mmetsp:Transcript_7921/g.22060  ORF Transcript_7921/g.22060 Transcript_7921/m.22060 type:complete len:291 (-) Transcript_7921:29-901(-)
MEAGWRQRRRRRRRRPRSRMLAGAVHQGALERARMILALALPPPVQQQQQQQLQFPGVQQPFQFPIQLARFSGMQQQQLQAQFAAAPANHMASVSAGSASSKSSKKKAGMTARRRGPPRGKYVDPRMTMAVKTKMANPDLPLQDALEAGGFVFVKDPNSNGMIDLDGTTLVQRKNNLCRRIRLEKEEQITPPLANTNVAFAMPPLPSTNFQGESFATAMVPQMQMSSTIGMDTSMSGGVDLQDYKLPAAAAPTNDAGTVQGNAQKRDSDSLSELPDANIGDGNNNGNFYI